jgi:hypothetical protein
MVSMRAPDPRVQLAVGGTARMTTRPTVADATDGRDCELTSRRHACRQSGSARQQKAQRHVRRDPARGFDLAQHDV